MRDPKSACVVHHPDNLLDTDHLPEQVETRLRQDGITFVAELETSNGQPFLLCGRRCPQEAGADMVRNALRVRPACRPHAAKVTHEPAAPHMGKRAANRRSDAATQSGTPV